MRSIQDIIQLIENNPPFLYLPKDQIGVDGAKKLAAALEVNESIATLHLYNNQIGAAGAKHLAEALTINIFITTLHISDNQIGASGAKDIAEALKVNNSIITLDLSSNQIEYAGAEELAVALKVNKTISTLHLSYNQIGAAGAKELANALKINKSITKLELSCNQIGVVGSKYLAQALKVNKSIITLDLSSNKIEYSGAEELAVALKFNKAITNLDLSYNEIGSAGAKELAKALKINTSIMTLDLSSNYIEYAGAEELAIALKVNKSITNLNLSYNQIGTVGVKALSSALKINNTITKLELSCNHIGVIGTKYLAPALKINKSIITLDLSSNQIEYNGAEELADVLRLNKSITNLYLSDNQIGYAGANQLIDALNINKSVTNLDLSYNQIGEAGAKELAETLHINRDIAGKMKQVTELKQLTERLNAIDREKQTKLAKKEAERLEKEKKRENAKAVKEAAKLEALEMIKVKEYMPDIPTVKLFKVEDRDNQSDNQDQTIEQVSSLIRDGNDRLQQHAKQGILVLGNTGAGKSTLAHLLSGKKLQAILDEETNELVIDAMQPLDDIIIGHKMASETKIPNKCFAKDLIIWDCPGFNDTDPVQEIANSFYIKRLFEITDQLKFLLVVAEPDLRSKRGSDFVEMLSNFMKCFNDFRSIENSISLVVTQVPKHKNIQHIRKSIEKVIIDNQRVSEEHKELVNKFKYPSLYLFHKPSEEGELAVPCLLEAIELSCKFSEVKSDMVSISISKAARECSSNLLNAASHNFNKLLEVIIKAIANATKCLNINPHNSFFENYALIKDWIPSSIQYNNLQKHGEDEYFLELELLFKLQNVLDCKQMASILDAIAILQQAVETFAEYAEPSNLELQHQIQGYYYCLQQQYEYVNFFSSVCEVELPDHTQIVQLISACHTNITENLEYQISSLHIDENRLDRVYYHQVIKYLENYQDSPVCMKLKAIACICLASILEQNDENQALAYYVKAIDADRRLPKIYEKFGELFSNKGKYSKAIDCYKVVNNVFMIKACFKAWLKQDKNNPNVMLKQAEYFESVGLFEQAKKYYLNAYGLSQDVTVKTTALDKVGKIMVNAITQGQDFITRAEEQDFYNYDSVDESFIRNLLDEATLTSDSYC